MTASKHYADHPIVRYVRSLRGDYFLAREVADQLGCSVSTISYLAKTHADQGLGPSHQVRYGSTLLRLYTPERVERIREYIVGMRARQEGNRRRRPGRTRLWNAREAHQRARAFDRARYYRNEARRAGIRGEAERAAELERKGRELHDRLVRAGVARRRRVKGTGRR
jgi:hypothetical protein